MIENKDITLYVTQQVIDEVKRNRDKIVSDGFEKFKDSQVNLKAPQICKEYEEYKTIIELISNFKKTKSELVQKLGNGITQRTLVADKIIEDLFSLALVLDSKKYITHAKRDLLKAIHLGKITHLVMH